MRSNSLIPEPFAYTLRQILRMVCAERVEIEEPDLPSNIGVLDINLTGICNLGCAYCFGEYDHRGDIDRSTLLRSISFAKSIGADSLEFCGGEPLVYKDFEWAIAEARNADFKLILRTNGLLVYRFRELIASSFDTVGISLDGEANGNHIMRPLKGPKDMDPLEKFDRAFSEFDLLKKHNPKLKTILASVASAKNGWSLKMLAGQLREMRHQPDTWKIYQFVANKFRSLDFEGEFKISDADFDDIISTIATLIGGDFRVLPRYSRETDGSCAIINTNGDLQVGSQIIGNVNECEFDELYGSLLRLPSFASISANKGVTYGEQISDGS